MKPHRRYGTYDGDGLTGERSGSSMSLCDDRLRVTAGHSGPSPQEGLTLTRGTRLSPASPLLGLCACLCMLYVRTSLDLPASRLAAPQVSFLWVVFVLTSLIYYMTWCNSTGLRWSRTDSCKLSLRTHAEKPAFSYSQNLLSVLKELHVQTCCP